ncbi:hypothetical protein HID58_009794 [Brassica napus]|uniref:Myb/SANT-like domain-containing protein n=2 Tax=Brassica napus TaxID=3708 RepID=A0ABQ8DRQ2_BRANA|nr:hypothetical protein HID58_009173 [Brassica napus]KAH0932677.1 hypothetical protein HID58_009794 [Brassica napus]
MFLLQLDKENWVDKSLTKEGKLRVRKNFKEATGFDLAWKNFANHLRNLKTWYDCYNRLCKYTGVTVDRITGVINMEDEWWNDRIQENDVARRFKKKSLANEDLLEKLFSGTHIGVEDGWSVGNGPDVYRPQHGYETGTQFDINTSFVSDDPDVLFSTSLDGQTQNMESTPTTIHTPSDERPNHEQRNKRKRGAANIDSQSDLSKAFRERSDAIKNAALEMSSALTSDITIAARRLHQIEAIEFGTPFYWDATNLLSTNESARRWFLGIQESKFALLYLEQMIGRKHDD